MLILSPTFCVSSCIKLLGGVCFWSHDAAILHHSRVTVAVATPVPVRDYRPFRFLGFSFVRIRSRDFAFILKP